MSGDGERDTVIMKLFADAHTIEIGHGFLLNSHDNFLSDLKSELGPQLKTIHFEVPEEAEPFQRSRGYLSLDGVLLKQIEGLVAYRFRDGQPFSSVERMMVSESERANGQQESA